MMVTPMCHIDNVICATLSVLDFVYITDPLASGGSGNGKEEGSAFGGRCAPQEFTRRSIASILWANSSSRCKTFPSPVLQY
jgi:hypothetical protein